MNNTVRIQLSVMMFLQYFIWGAWFVAMGIYLPAAMKADALQVGLAYGNAWFGALVSPFIVGLIADRFFSAQKVFAVLHLLGAGLLWYLADLRDLSVFPWVLLVYSCLYMPTVSLSNAVAMRQSPNASGDFPTLRVLGTIGWIMAGVAVSEKATESFIFQLPAVVSLVLGVWGFFLPDTPPKDKAGQESLAQMAGLDAIGMLKDRSYLVFFVGSILLCIPLSFYYAFTGDYLGASGVQNVTSKMGLLGQGSEVIFMLLMPLFLTRLGVRRILLIAIGAWMARYLLLSFGGPSMHFPLYLAVALHGICYDFFFVTGFIYTDEKAEKNSRSSAQGLFTIATYGIGMTVGSYVGGAVAAAFTHEGVRDWSGMWLVPAGIAAVLLAAFLLFFREASAPIQPAEGATA